MALSEANKPLLQIRDFPHSFSLSLSFRLPLTLPREAFPTRGYQREDEHSPNPARPHLSRVQVMSRDPPHPPMGMSILNFISHRWQGPHFLLLTLILVPCLHPSNLPTASIHHTSFKRLMKSHSWPMKANSQTWPSFPQLTWDYLSRFNPLCHFLMGAL